MNVRGKNKRGPFCGIRSKGHPRRGDGWSSGKEGFKGNIKVLEGLKKVDVAVKDLQRVGTDLITKRRSEMNLEMIVKFAQGKVEQAGNGWVEKDEHGEWVDCTEQVNAPSPSDAALSRYLRMVGGARLLGRRV